MFYELQFAHTHTHSPHINLHFNKKESADSNEIKPDGEETADDIWPSEDDNKSAKAQSKVEPDKASEKARTDAVEVYYTDFVKFNSMETSVQIFYQ